LDCFLEGGPIRCDKTFCSLRLKSGFDPHDDQPMPDQDSPAVAQFWRQRATFLAMKLNFHHWLTRVVPVLFVLLVLVALFDLFRRETALPSRWSGAFLLLGTAIASAWAWLWARSHFCTWTQALVRIETVMGLHSQLSSAQDGVLPWPAPRRDTDDGYVANWKHILMPLLAGIIFLWSAHLIPVSRTQLGTSSEPISEPPEFAQVQNWINALKSDDLIEPAKLQEMQAALDKLRERPAQDWYTQSNLEAANSLKELTEQSMNSLAQDLDQADQAVQAMREKEASSSDASSLQPMQEKLQAAGENLASGNLPLNREIVGQMTAQGAASDKPLTAKQLEALHDRLKKGELAAQTAPKTNGGLSDEMQRALAGAAMGQGKGRREGSPGPGGTGGGEETAPLELQPRDKNTPEGPRTSVSSDDMNHVALGETVKVSAGEHAVDPAAYKGTQSAGAAQVEGSGGEAVWRSTYDPQEADTLSRYFK
jgi:hypothetical protein